MNTIAQQLERTAQPLADNPETAYQYTFTVFTPTYNRARTLPRVYASLEAQTYRNFEWLIVDDGSTDETRNLVTQWQQTASFPIRYLYQTNSGKHVAYNRAAREALGEFLICLDSDDGCIPKTLERFKHHWETIPPQQRSQFSGIDCHCLDSNGNLIGDLYPASPCDSNFAEMRYRYKVKGEKWGFQRTDVMREFQFPELPGHRLTHIPESVVWVSLTKKYPARYVNEALRIYYANSGQDQLTKLNLAAQNPMGYCLACKYRLETEIEYFFYNPKHFLAGAVNYIRSHLHLRTSLPQQFSELHSLPGRLLWIAALPLGYFYWLKDKARIGWKSAS